MIDVALSRVEKSLCHLKEHNAQRSDMSELHFGLFTAIDGQYENEATEYEEETAELPETCSYLYSSMCLTYPAGPH